MNKCEHLIGIRYDYESTDAVTLAELKEHIASEKKLAELKKDDEWWQSVLNHYTLADYCDRRKTTNLMQFNYCPNCGEKINWKEMRSNSNER